MHNVTDEMGSTGLPLTFLFTDIESSSRLWEEAPLEMQAALERHEALLGEAIAGNNGRVFKSGGDALFAVFEDPSSAIMAAVQGQLGLQSEKWALGEALRVRMALHTGQAQNRDGDFFGPTLNKCSRILAAAHGGQILLSDAVEGRARGGLPEAVLLRSLGEFRLREIRSPVSIFQALHAGLQSDFPQLVGVVDALGNLPLQFTSFVGREREMDEVLGLLETERLVTLVGPGGCGKTRLAVEAAAQIVPLFEHGVAFMEMESLSADEDIASELASSLGLKEAAGMTSLETLKQFLMRRRMLIVVDNCEHVLAPLAEVLASILRAAPEVKILATSREALNVPGERAISVTSLELPKEKEASVEELAANPSVQLFVDRAAAQSAQLSVSESTAPHLSQICRLLDGIPLAIELAAGWSRTLSPRQLAERLEHQFAFLAQRGSSAPKRHQTLAAAIDWSYEALDESTQTVFRRLSAFSGGWSLEGAEAVCRDCGDVLSALRLLVDKSLVITEEGLRGEWRYRFYETIRRYAREKMDEAGETEDAERRHFEYWQGLALEAEVGLIGDEQSDWLTLLFLERDNIRAALGYAAAHGLATDGLRMASALWRYWYYRGALSEGRSLVETLLAAGADAPVEIRATAMNAAGVLAIGQGDLVGGEKHHRLALELSDGARYPRGIATALHNLGMVASDRGDLQESRRLYERALEITREMGEPVRIAATLMNLGCIAYDESRFDDAEPLLEESLAIQRRLKNKWYMAKALHNLGEMHLQQGKLEISEEEMREALSLFLELADRDAASSVMVTLGLILEKKGCDPEAIIALVAARAARTDVEGTLQERTGIEMEAALERLKERLGPVTFESHVQRGLSLELAEAEMLSQVDAHAQAAGGIHNDD